MTLRVDHMMPVSRGGTLGFENLCCSCDDCNRIKGELTAEEFKAVTRTLTALVAHGELAPQGFTDITKRLKGQVLHFKRNREKAKPEKPSP